MSRLKALKKDEMTTAQRAVYESIVGGKRQGQSTLAPLTGDDGSLLGPFNAFLLSPAIGDALQQAGSALRYDSTLSARVREMAILVVAARWSCEFEQYVHERIGRSCGLEETEIAVLRQGKLPELVDDQEVVALSVVEQLIVGADLDDEGWVEARLVLGDRAVFELTTLIGHYASLALQLRVFRVGVVRTVDTQ